MHEYIHIYTIQKSILNWFKNNICYGVLIMKIFLLSLNLLILHKLYSNIKK